MMNTTLSPWVLSIASAGLLAIGTADGVYTHRVAKAQQSLQAAMDAQGETIQKLSHSLNEAKEGYSDLKGEVTFTKDRLGMAQVELRKSQQRSAQLTRQQKEAANQWGSQLGQLQQEQATTQGTVGSLSSDVAGVKDGLNSTKERLDSTRSDLQRMVGDLGVQSDLIARNRSELEELRVRGERDYYEFDLPKTKQPQRVGDIAIGLRKADTKRQRYTINLIADDRTIEKKDKTVNEPVQFYQAGLRQPSEIVVNQVYKDRIVGYVSVPKKKQVRPTLTETGSAGSKTSS